MSNVFVLDTNKQPLDPVPPGRARILLSTGKAAVLRHYPFTIILKTEAANPQVRPLRLKLDPGSKTTGLALVNDTSGEVVAAFELQHRGQAIKSALDARRAVRRSRRSRHTRYRKPRCANRKRREGSLPPSLHSRLANIETWVKRLMRLCPIAALSQELVKFDLQQLEHPEIEGVEYQQGELQGYELREYLTGDLVRAVVPAHLKNAGTYVGRMSAKARGAFTIATSKGTVPDIGKHYCRKLQRADGYGYQQKGEAAVPPIPF